MPEAIWMVAALLSYFVKGLCGFANTLVFTSMLSFSNDNAQITPVDLLLGYPANLAMVWRERRAISMRVALPLSLIVIAGDALGAFFLKGGNPALIKLLFGFVVLGVSGEMVWREIRLGNGRRKDAPAALAAIGVLSGVMCGLFGVGALLAAYLRRSAASQSAFKGTLCFVFSVEMTARIALYALTGVFTATSALTVLKLAPFMAAGLICGMLLSGRVNERIARRITIAALVASGVALVCVSAAGL